MTREWLERTEDVQGALAVVTNLWVEAMAVSVAQMVTTVVEDHYNEREATGAATEGHD